MVGTSDGKLLVWDLDALVPRAFGDDAISSARFVTADQLVVAYADSPAQWIDLKSDKITTLGTIAGIAQLAAAPV